MRLNKLSSTLRAPILLALTAGASAGSSEGDLACFFGLSCAPHRGDLVLGGSK